MSENTPIVVYHSPCMDGFTAAWACWLVHPDWVFVPGVHGLTIPLDRFEGRDVYFLDFSYKLPIMQRIISAARSVTVLDHHISAQVELQELFDQNKIKGKFDMKCSGAYLSWEFFHPSKLVPAMVSYVEDRDLWRQPRRYHETDPFNAFMFSQNYSFQKWSDINHDMQHNDRFVDMLNQGNAILRKQEKDIRELIDSSTYTAYIGGHAVPIINLPYMFSSDAGNKMSKGKPFAASYFFNGEKFQFSLRSDEYGLDVSLIAKKYGGGGHKHAAGFQVRLLEDL